MLEDIKNYTLIDIDPSFEQQVENWITQVQTYIETVTQRNFEAQTETRKYDGRGGTELLVDEFTELTEVKIDDNVQDDVLTYPANTVPKFKLYIEDGIDRGKQNVEVTAKFGYSDEIPEDIRFAIVVLVSGILQKQNKLEGDVQSERIGNYQVTYTDIQKQDFDRAMQTMIHYKKITI